MLTLTPPLPGESWPLSAATSIPPCQGSGGVFPSAPSPDTRNDTTATGGGVTSSALVREALRARLTAALEQLDVVADHALPVFAEGVALGLCRDAGLPPSAVVPAEELDPMAMIRRWADQEDSCRDR